MQLPFLKKWPRVNPDPLEEKTFNQSFEDKLEEHCMEELIEAVHLKDVGRFRSALEALILGCFEDGEAPDAAD